MSLRVKRKELVRSQRVEAIGVAGLIAKLDLEGVIGENLDDRSNFSSGKPKLRHIGDERDSVEKLNL